MSNVRASTAYESNLSFTMVMLSPFPPCSGCDIVASWCGGGLHRGA